MYLPTNRGFDEYYGIPYSVDEGATVWDLQFKYPPLPLVWNTTIIEQAPLKIVKIPKRSRFEQSAPPLHFTPWTMVQRPRRVCWRHARTPAVTCVLFCCLGP